MYKETIFKHLKPTNLPRLSGRWELKMNIFSFKMSKFTLNLCKKGFELKCETLNCLYAAYISESFIKVSINLDIFDKKISLNQLH